MIFSGGAPLIRQTAERWSRDGKVPRRFDQRFSSTSLADRSATFSWVGFSHRMEYEMKLLFILARACRSVSTLGPDLNELADKIGRPFDNAVTCGDLIFWPVRAVSGSHRMGDHTREFWDVYGQALQSGLLSEIVIGELGSSMFSAGYSDHVDSFQGEDYVYGNPPSLQQTDDADFAG